MERRWGGNGRASKRDRGMEGSHHDGSACYKVKPPVSHVAVIRCMHKCVCACTQIRVSVRVRPIVVVGVEPAVDVTSDGVVVCVGDRNKRFAFPTAVTGCDQAAAYHRALAGTLQTFAQP